MLVLGRKLGQRIVVSGPCVLTVVKVKANGEVKLGFDAEPHVIIHREEIQKLIDGGSDVANS